MDIVCAFQSLTNRKCKEIKAIDMIVRTPFYEHTVRNQDDYDEAARYIAENPLKWSTDRLYCV